MDELKNCPFCGQKPDTERNWRSDVVRCHEPDCFINRLGFSYPDSWNTRPIEDALRDEIAVLRAELEQERKQNESLRVMWQEEHTEKIRLGARIDYLTMPAPPEAD